MAVIRRGRGSRSRVIVAAGLLAVAAFASMPARSAVVVAPVLESTSIANGWANGNFVMARFDQAIARRDTAGNVVSTSTATVTEADGTAVAGLVSFAAAEFATRLDVIVWTANLTGREDAQGNPLRALPEGDYRINITAVSPTSNMSTTVPQMSYRIDSSAPFNPVFMSPEGSGNVPIVDVALPSAEPLSGDIQLQGVVSDRRGSANGAFKSGIAKVTLYFFNATDPFAYALVDTQGPGGVSIPTPQNTETKSLRRAATLAACNADTAGCPGVDEFGNPILVQDKSFSATISDLDPGLWTVKAIATDAAGNQSQEVNVSFLYLG